MPSQSQSPGGLGWEERSVSMRLHPRILGGNKSHSHRQGPSLMVVSPPSKSWFPLTRGLGRKFGLCLSCDQGRVGIQPVGIIRTRTHCDSPQDSAVAYLPRSIIPVSVASSTSASQVAPSWLSLGGASEGASRSLPVEDETPALPGSCFPGLLSLLKPSFSTALLTGCP